MHSPSCHQKRGLLLAEHVGQDISLVADGLASAEGLFLPIPRPDPGPIVLLFRQKLTSELLAWDKIARRMVEILFSWRHPCFSVHHGER